MAPSLSSFTVDLEDREDVLDQARPRANSALTACLQQDLAAARALTKQLLSPKRALEQPDAAQLRSGAEAESSTIEEVVNRSQLHVLNQTYAEGEGLSQPGEMLQEVGKSCRRLVGDGSVRLQHSSSGSSSVLAARGVEEHCQGLEAEMQRQRMARVQRSTGIASALVRVSRGETSAGIVISPKRQQEFQQPASLNSLQSAVTLESVTSSQSAKPANSVDTGSYPSSAHSSPQRHAGTAIGSYPSSIYSSPQRHAGTTIPKQMWATPEEMWKDVAHHEQMWADTARLKQILPSPDHTLPKCMVSESGAASPKQSGSIMSNECLSRAQQEVNTISSRILGLPALPSLSLDLAWATGPHESCNYVLPGILIVGSYPGAATEPEHTSKITSLLKAGVDCFLCCQELWELRSRCRPYVSLAQQLAESLARKAGLSTGPPEFWHCPIPDQAVTTLTQLEAAVATVVDRLLAGRCVYVHSWGGNGRAGTIICALLVRAFGMTVEEAQRYFMATHDTRLAHNQWSPGCWPHSPVQLAQVQQLEGQCPEVCPRRLQRLEEWG